MHLLWTIVLLLVLCCAWLTNVVGLPGNWIMVACALAYWAWMPEGSSLAISLELVIALAAIAALGELLELIAGSAGVSRASGSRRSALYAIAGSIAGALLGLVVGVPIPVIGPIVGSLLFGCFGAMTGAMYGERHGGRNWGETFQVGKAAFLARALGTLAKMAAGLVMLIIALAGVMI